MKWYEYTKRLMADKKITQDDLIETFGVKTRGAVGHYLSGRREPSAAQLIALAKKLNCSLDNLFGVSKETVINDYIEGEVVRLELPTPESNAIYLGGFELWDSETPLSSDEVALPFFREVKLSAGSGSSEVQENHGYKLRFAKSTLKSKSVQPEHAYCVTVKGNSMEPVLPDGCTVGIDTGKTEVINGEWYAIDHLGELRVKVMYRLTGGGYRLRSFNIDEYPDEFPVPENEVRVLGRVFWWSGLR